MNSKKTAFGATAAVAALALTAVAGPAMADDDTTYTSSKSWSSYSNESPVVIAPEVGFSDVLSLGVLNGDLFSGNALASGNDITAPVASGNETAVGSGNDTAVGNGSANGNDIGGDIVTDVVDDVSGGDVTSDIGGSVSDIVDGVVDVDGILEDVTGSLDLGGLLN